MDNGKSGYILKPEYLRANSSKERDRKRKREKEREREKKRERERKREKEKREKEREKERNRMKKEKETDLNTEIIKNTQNIKTNIQNFYQPQNQIQSKPFTLQLFLVVNFRKMLELNNKEHQREKVIKNKHE